MDDLNTYTVKWCRKAKQFIGTCEQYPKLKFFSDDRNKAMQGIQKLVTNALNNDEIKELLVGSASVTKEILLENQ